MSGGIGPCDDLGVTNTKDDADAQRKQHPAGATTTTTTHRRVFSFSQLNALAVIVVLSTSGMVSFEDFAFLIFSLFYTLFLSTTAFPPLPATPAAADPGGGRALSVYNRLGAVVGLFIPIAYIFEGILEGDKEGIKAATPHVFLLAGQIFVEGVAGASRRFSLPIRVFVPVFYGAKRLLALSEWVRSEVAKAEQEERGSARRLQVGRALAVVNFAFWAFYLLGFLIPVYLPRAFKRYYGHNKDKL